MKAEKYVIQKHQQRNNLYDGYLPYEFHLRMTYNVGVQFVHLLNDDQQIDSITGKWECDRGVDHTITEKEACLEATWTHDLIENYCCNYNDIKSYLSVNVAEITFACTNEKGRNRAERANSKYYEGILACKGALFVKLCDRIANVSYSIQTKSNKLKMYQSEQKHFESSLRDKNNDKYKEMWDYLNNILTTKLQ